MENLFKKKVIKRGNFPSRLPLFQTIIYFLALDYWNAPQWLWGALGFFMLIVWIVMIVGMANEEDIDLFKDKN